MKATKKDNNTKNTVYLTETMYELFKTYPKSFNKISMREKNEGKIDYKHLSYKIYFNEENHFRFHEIDFLENFGTLYDLLKNLVTNKISMDIANSDQIHCIINLMTGYDKNDLFAKENKNTQGKE